MVPYSIHGELMHGVQAKKIFAFRSNNFVELSDFRQNPTKSPRPLSLAPISILDAHSAEFNGK